MLRDSSERIRSLTPEAVTELANPGATHKWNILTSLNEDLMKTLKS